MGAHEALGAQFDPSSLHPNLSKNYRDAGELYSGNGGADNSFVGYVRTSTLRGMRGNEPGNETRVQQYQSDLRSGRGFKDPVMVDYDPKSRLAFLGEGNHRVEAAHREGHEYVPARVVRARGIDPDYVKGNGGNAVTLPPKEAKYRDGGGYPYHPPQMHPSFVFPDADLFHDRRTEGRRG